MAMIHEIIQQGIVHHRAGRLAEAEQCYRQSLDLDPLQPDGLHLMGVIALQSGQMQSAADYIGRAIAQRPGNGEYHAHLGRALQGLDRPDDAIREFRRAIELNPRASDAYLGLGLVLKNTGRSPEALIPLRRALELEPRRADILNSLGNALQESGQLTEAVECFEKCLKLKPDFAEAHNNFGNTLQLIGEFQRAIDEYQRAIELRGGYANAYNNLGQAQQMNGQHGDALGSYQNSLHLRPNYPNAHYNRALLLLLQGNYAAGWDEYEWRWHRTGMQPRVFAQPQWDGSDLTGRTILLYAEQGLGDTLHFVRYASLVKKRGGRVVVECQRPLRKLLGTCPGIDQIVAEGDELPAFDVQAALMSLPRILGTRLESIPAEVRYLSADPELVARWGQQLRGAPGLKVGIAWQGDPSHKRDRFRSIPLAKFEPLSRVPGVTLYSLQKGFGREQLATIDFPVVDLSAQLDNTVPFADTAAVLSHLSVVISADTSLIHLAGALGARSYVAVSASPDFRWLLNRSTSPWYPSVEIFRQGADWRWEPVFAEMATRLSQLASTV